MAAQPNGRADCAVESQPHEFPPASAVPRRWSDAAYEHRLAYLAESVPGHVAQFLPVALLFGPFLPFVVVIIFGASVFNAFLIALLIFLIAVALLIASADGMLAGGFDGWIVKSGTRIGPLGTADAHPGGSQVGGHHAGVLHVNALDRPLVGTMDSSCRRWPHL